jgi:hypothetical protein
VPHGHDKWPNVHRCKTLFQLEITTQTQLESEMHESNLKSGVIFDTLVTNKRGKVNFTFYYFDFQLVWLL